MPTDQARPYQHIEFVPIFISALLMLLWGQLDTSHHHANHIHLYTWLFVALMAALGLMGGFISKFTQHKTLLDDILDGLSLFALGILGLSVGLYSLVNALYVAMILVRVIKMRPSTRLIKLLVALGLLVGAYVVLSGQTLEHDLLVPVLPEVMQAVLLAIGLVGVIADFYVLSTFNDPDQTDNPSRSNRLSRQVNKPVQTATSNDAVLNERIKELVLVINNLTRYIPNQLRSSIIREHHTPTIYKKRTELSLMFADMVGFTQLSESLSAEHLADILNTYMQAMTHISTRHGALLDKFIGDGMVCFFGYPKSNDARSDAVACVAMALDMRKEMQLLSGQWRMMGVENIHIRIGINTGYCHVGNYGSKDRMSFTVIGREVNFAARLEAAAQPKEILISQSTYELVRHRFHCQHAGSLKIAGFDNVLPCYRVVREKNSAETDNHR